MTSLNLPLPPPNPLSPYPPTPPPTHLTAMALLRNRFFIYKYIYKYIYIWVFWYDNAIKETRLKEADFVWNSSQYNNITVYSNKLRQTILLVVFARLYMYIVTLSLLFAYFFLS